MTDRCRPKVFSVGKEAEHGSNRSAVDAAREPGARRQSVSSGSAGHQRRSSARGQPARDQSPSSFPRTPRGHLAPSHVPQRGPTRSGLRYRIRFFGERRPVGDWSGPCVAFRFADLESGFRFPFSSARFTKQPGVEARKGVGPDRFSDTDAERHKGRAKNGGKIVS